ncbi:hypothetical protein [Chitinophaga sancti]|uniref:hypothetical protein n=1 Tax=Chitinophaga sancti TaxID=1004 RepID=UPI003F79534F
MSFIHSNLSGTSPSPDFVLAVTQKSINASLKHRLYRSSKDQELIWFGYGDNGQPKEYDFLTMRFRAGNTNFFDIPEGARVKENKVLENYQKAGFIQLIRLKPGIPRVKNLAMLPPVIKFGTDSEILYTLLFEEFTVITLRGEGPSAQLEYSRQPLTGIYQVKVKAGLKFINIDADPATNKNNSSFSLNGQGQNRYILRQLVADSSKAQIISLPGIDAIGAGSVQEKRLQTLYINLMQKNMIVLGTVALEQDPPPTIVNIGTTRYTVPTPRTSTNLPLKDVTFFINHFKGDKPLPQPADDSRSGFSSLNFACSVGSGAAVRPASLSWDWIEPKVGKIQADGVLAIRKDAFLNWLSDLVAPFFRRICLQPSCTVESGWSMTYDLKFAEAGDSQQFKIIPKRTYPDGFNCVMALAYQGESSDSCFQVYSWGNLECRYSVASEIYIKDNKIKFYTNVNVWLHINFDSGVTEGNFAKYVIEQVFDLHVNAYGKIQLQRQPTIISDKSETYDVSFWTKLISFGRFDDLLDLQKKFKAGYYDSLINNLDGIEKGLNGAAAMIFPGGNSFVFKDVQFSEGLDLVAHIVHADPDNNTNAN